MPKPIDQAMQPLALGFLVSALLSAAGAAADDPLPPGAAMRIAGTPFHGDSHRLSPDGHRVAYYRQQADATGWVGGVLAVADVASGKVLAKRAVKVQRGAAAWLDADTVLVWEGPPEATVLTAWRVQGEVAYEIAERAQDLVCFAVSPAADAIVARFGERPLAIWDARTGKRRLELARAPGAQDVRSVRFRHDGLQVLGLDFDGRRAHLWDPKTGAHIGEVKYPEESSIDPDRGLATLGGPVTPTVVIDLFTGKPQGSLEGTDLIVRGISRDGQRVFGSISDPKRRVLDVAAWDARSGKRLRGPWDRPGEVYELDIDPAGRHLVARVDGDPVVIDLAAGRVLFEVQVPVEVGLDHEGTNLHVRYVGNADAPGRRSRLVTREVPSARIVVEREAALCDLREGVALIDLGDQVVCRSAADWQPIGSPLRVTATTACLAAGGRFALVLVGEEPKLWEIATGRVRPLLGPARIWECELSPDAKAAVVTGNPGSGEAALTVYDAASGRVVRALKKEGTSGDRPTYTSDGALLAAVLRADTSAVTVWEAATLKSKWRCPTDASALAFSADGKRLVAGTPSGEVLVYDMTTGKSLAAFRGGHDAMVRSVAASADGHTVASLGDDGSVVVWKVPAAR